MITTPKVSLYKNNIDLHRILLICVLCLSIFSCGGSGKSQPDEQQPMMPIAPPMSPPTPTEEMISLNEVSAGLCVDVVEEINGIEFVNTKNCDQAHEYEVAGTYELDSIGDEYPGNIALSLRVHKECRPLFKSHTGQDYTGKGLGIETITPSVSTWSDGDRTVICLVANADRSPLNSPVSVQ
jgi:hypothetical protein